MDEQKTCNRCSEAKPPEGFYLRNGKSVGWCKACYRAWHRGRYIPKDGAGDEPRECVRCAATYSPKTRRVSVYCSRECKEAHRVESGKAREAHLRRQYGITSKDYEQMLAEQGGGCAICGNPPERSGRYQTYLHIDHCHDTGKIRGLLCGEHNLLLGRWGDSIEGLRKAVEYLSRKGRSNVQVQRLRTPGQTGGSVSHNR